MTTKQQTPAVETVAVETPHKPYFLRLVGPTIPTLQQAVVHIRSGYTFAPEAVEFFGPMGTCALTLVLGQPEPYLVEKAEQAVAAATAQEQANHKRAVAEEARRIIEEEKRLELEKKVAAAVAEHQKAIEKLKAANEAEVHLLQQQAAAEMAKLGTQ